MTNCQKLGWDTQKSKTVLSFAMNYADAVHIYIILDHYTIHMKYMFCSTRQNTLQGR